MHCSLKWEKGGRVMEKVAAVKCQSYELNEVVQAVKEGLDAIDFLLPENKRVLIKPNLMSQNRPSQHTITHYALIDALCALLQENHCEIFIGDGISFYQQGLTRKAFNTAGLSEVAKKYNAHLVPFDEVPLCAVAVNLPGVKELYLPEILFDVDLVINACKLKTHSGMRLSGAVKNIFGCLPGGYKQKIHQQTGNEFELAAVMVALHQQIKPALSVMDAIVSLDGGPTALGKPVKTQRLFFSTNAAALDVVAGKMIGYEPGDLPILLEARKSGLIYRFEDIKILGEPGSFRFKSLVKADLFRKSNPTSIFVKQTWVALYISGSRCSLCQKCLKACPVGAIRVIDGKPGDDLEYRGMLLTSMAMLESAGKITLDQKACISCYYCLSVCPEKAIRVKPKPMNLLIRGIRTIARL